MIIREKVLIVEDEKSIAHFISTILTTNGYETILAKTAPRRRPCSRRTVPTS